MANVPIASAVLLMHHPDGATSICDSSGGMSAAATNNVLYTGRLGRYEELGGVDRGMTAQDQVYQEARRLGIEASRTLDYNAREGEFEQKGADKMEDATYWGKYGAIERGALEADMVQCGGAFLRSVVTVKRDYADVLGINSKDAFQELIRDNWGKMMVAAGLSENENDIHWCASYHTDQPNNLHVHITTWVADGSIKEGHHITAAQTREQKAILYHDAYSAIRLERDIMQSMYRDTVLQIARVELGYTPEPAALQRIQENAVRLGIEPPSISRSLNTADAAYVARKVAKVIDTYKEGSLTGGRALSNWQLRSALREVQGALREKSPQFNAAYEGYRGTVEAKADLNGLAIGGLRQEDAAEQFGEMRAERVVSGQEVAAHERDRFIRREMTEGSDSLATRLDNRILKTIVPDLRMQESRREVVRDFQKQVLRDALDPVRNKLQLNAADMEYVKETLQKLAVMVKQNPDGLTDAQVAEQKTIVEQVVVKLMAAPGMEHVLNDAIRQLQALSSDYQTMPIDDIRRMLSSELRGSLEWYIGARLERGAVYPYRPEQLFTQRVEAQNVSMNMVRAFYSQGPRRFGIDNETHALFKGHIDAIRAETKGLHLGKNEYLKESMLSDAGKQHMHEAVKILLTSPAIQQKIDAMLPKLSIQYDGVSVVTKDTFERAIAGSLEFQVLRTAQYENIKEDARQSNNLSADISIMMSQIVRNLMKTGNIPSAYGQRRKRDQSHTRAPEGRQRRRSEMGL